MCTLFWYPGTNVGFLGPRHISMINSGNIGVSQVTNNNLFHGNNCILGHSRQLMVSSDVSKSHHFN